MKTLNRKPEATIGEALNYGEVPTYGEMIVTGAFIFAVMFAVMGFTHSDKMGMMGVIGLIASVLLAVVGIYLFYKRCKDVL